MDGRRDPEGATRPHLDQVCILDIRVNEHCYHFHRLVGRLPPVADILLFEPSSKAIDFSAAWSYIAESIVKGGGNSLAA